MTPEHILEIQKQYNDFREKAFTTCLGFAERIFPSDLEKLITQLSEIHEKRTKEDV